MYSVDRWIRNGSVDSWKQIDRNDNKRIGVEMRDNGSLREKFISKARAMTILIQFLFLFHIYTQMMPQKFVCGCLSLYSIAPSM